MGTTYWHNLYGIIVRTGVPTTFVGTTVITKVTGRAVPASVVRTMVIVSVVPTRVFQLVLLEQRL